MVNVNPLTSTDFYKTGHHAQYPEGTEVVFSNITPRKSRMDRFDSVTFFGLQYWIKEYLIKNWNEGFFNIPLTQAIDTYKRRLEGAGLGLPSYDHIADLHNIGYMPLEIRALPEGADVPMGIPPLVMWNTEPEAFWVTNFLETSLSASLWKPITSATIARGYRQIFEDAMETSGGDPEFINFMGHDFSMRGMSSLESSSISGAAHLLSFNGTDTIPAIDFMEDYYGANSDTALVGASVGATEHSVMSLGSGYENEFSTYERLLTDVYPSGIVSIVSDTYDYWHVLTDFLPRLKDRIMDRDGCCTIRPDSGNPEYIICGDPGAEPGSPAHKGSMQLLWETFGGTINEKGFKQLDPHVNLIYGDSITLDRAEIICNRLVEQGFVPSTVYGIGSYTYNTNSRDTFGLAMKATAGVVNGELYSIFKDPVTDDGTKTSARGLLAVYGSNGEYTLKQEASWDDVTNCAFEPVFQNGSLVRDTNYSDIRELISGN